MDCVACGLKATTRILIDDEVFNLCEQCCEQCKELYYATIQAMKIYEALIKEGGNKG